MEVKEERPFDSFLFQRFLSNLPPFLSLILH